MSHRVSGNVAAWQGIKLKRANCFVT